MSAELQWAVIRKTSSFIVKNRTGNRAVFSSEKFNLSNKHSFSANGLVNKKAVDVSAYANGKITGVTFTTKKATGLRKPKTNTVAVNMTHGARPTFKSISNVLKSYRKDLSKVAVARASAIIAAQKKKSPKVRKGRATKA